jgi:hypothetical protein
MSVTSEQRFLSYYDPDISSIFVRVLEIRKPGRATSCRDPDPEIRQLRIETVHSCLFVVYKIDSNDPPRTFL